MFNGAIKYTAWGEYLKKGGLDDVVVTLSPSPVISLSGPKKNDVLRLGEMIMAPCIRAELLVQSCRTLFNFVWYTFTYFITIYYHSAFYLTTMCCKWLFLVRNLLVVLHHHNLFKVWNSCLLKGWLQSGSKDENIRTMNAWNTETDGKVK